MAGFTFSMQSVLRLKKQQVSQIRHELAMRLMDLRREERKLKSLVRERQDILNQFEKSNLSAMSLQTHYACRKRIQDRIEEKQKAVAICDKHVAGVRDRLLKMTKEREILVKLREREYEAYLAEEQSQEQKAVDETVSYMYNVKNRAVAQGGDRN